MNTETILISGGASGIGKYLVNKLSDDSFSIVTLDKSIDTLEELYSNNSNVLYYGCDLTNPEEVERAIDFYESKGMLPSVLINNAGIIHSEPLINFLDRENPKHDFGTWKNVIDANLSSTFLLSRELVSKWLKARVQGCVINISSISAQGNPGQSAYSAAKAGVNALTLTWSKELAPFGIRSNSIAPGFFDTPSTRAALNDSKLNKVISKVPLGRLGDLSEIYKTILFIIGNKYLNGAIIELDGGLSI